MHKIKTTLAASVVTLALASGAQAGGTWSLGALIEAQTGYYAGQKNELTLLPYISFESDRFQFSLHDGVAYHALLGEGPGGHAARLSVLLAPRWEPDFGEGALFDGLKRDSALELGLRGQVQSRVFFAEAEMLADISRTHRGHEASVLVGLQYETGRFSLKGGMGARYRSGDLNQHLFGVTAAEATTARAAFAPGQSTTGFASVTATYAINDTMALVGDISFEDLGKMERSPLVTKGSNTSFAVGLIFQF